MTKNLYYKILTSILMLSLVTSIYAQNKGTIDSTFGVNGKVIDNLQGIGKGGWLHIEDKIISASSYVNNTNFYQYFSDGTLNNQWGQNGSIELEYSSTIVNDSLQLLSVRDLLIQPDGKILLTNFFENQNYNNVWGGLIRYLPNGIIDSSFGNNGFVVQEREEHIVVFPHLFFHRSIVVNQKILTFGLDSINSLVIYAFNLNTGNIDSTWGNNGIVRHNFQYINNTGGIVSDIVVLSNGKIIFPYKDMLFCLLANGQLDTTFGSGGYVDPLFASQVESEYLLYYNYTNGYLKVEKQNDDKILVAGKASQYSINNGYNIVERYLPNGQLDSTFADNGILLVDFSTDTLTKNYFADFIVEESDSFIVAGNVVDTATGKGYFAMRRFTPNGKIDTLFGDTGLVVANLFLENDSIDYLTNVLIQSDGKIVLTGSGVLEDNNNSDTTYYNLMIRYNGGDYIRGGTSISEKINELNFNIYPNPAKNTITIDFEIENKTNIEIVMFDLQGKKVWTLLKDKIGIGGQNYTFYIPQGINNGIYFVQIKSDKASTTKSIQIIK